MENKFDRWTDLQSVLELKQDSVTSFSNRKEGVAQDIRFRIIDLVWFSMEEQIFNGMKKS